MFRKQGISAVFMFIIISMLCFMSSAYAKEDVAGKTYYTLCNMWYEQPEKIYSTNYHKGAIIPAGSKVTINNISGRGIDFTDESGINYKILYMQKHSPGVSVEEHFDRYFSEQDPMRPNGPFRKFTKSEQDNINSGIIEVGMSKEAVIMSFGYPPPIRTQDVKVDLWVYMRDRFVTKSVQFKDNKVVSAGR